LPIISATNQSYYIILDIWLQRLSRRA